MSNIKNINKVTYTVYFSIVFIFLVSLVILRIYGQLGKAIFIISGKSMLFVIIVSMIVYRVLGKRICLLSKCDSDDWDPIVNNFAWVGSSLIYKLFMINIFILGISIGAYGGGIAVVALYKLLPSLFYFIIGWR